MDILYRFCCDIPRIKFKKTKEKQCASLTHLITLIRSLPRVSPPVHLQLCRGGERLLTRLAPPLALSGRVRVPVGVVVEAVARGERRPAGGTDERALEGVSGAHVVRQVDLLEEAQAAVGTGVGAVARVRFLVSF